MNEDELLIALDRLTRFKNPAKKYKRVFFDILTKFLIEPKMSLNKLEKLEASQIGKMVCEIFNSSVGANSQSLQACATCEIQNVLFKEDADNFYIDEYTLKLMQTPLDIEGVLKKIEFKESMPVNVRRLYAYSKNQDMLALRNSGYLFPIKKVVLCEGITEEILLPEFAKAAGKDFNKNGIFILGAGGKNQVARKFYELYDVLKIPIFVLLDSDAQKTANVIYPKLRKEDKIHIIKSGEFEDILPLNLIIKSLNNKFKDCYCVEASELQKNENMVKILHDLYKLKGWGEFKKAEFASIIKTNISDTSDLSPQIEEILNCLT